MIAATVILNFQAPARHVRGDGQPPQSVPKTFITKRKDSNHSGMFRSSNQHPIYRRYGSEKRGIPADDRRGATRPPTAGAPHASPTATSGHVRPPGTALLLADHLLPAALPPFRPPRHSRRQPRTHRSLPVAEARRHGTSGCGILRDGRFALSHLSSRERSVRASSTESPAARFHQ